MNRDFSLESDRVGTLRVYISYFCAVYVVVKKADKTTVLLADVRGIFKTTIAGVEDTLYRAGDMKVR